jgi:hypothetical protein
MTDDDRNIIVQLEQKIASARSEANAWKNKSEHHYKMGSLLADGWEKELRELYDNIAAKK